MVGENSNKSKLVKNKKRGLSSFKGKSTNFSKKPTVGGCRFCGRPGHRKKDYLLFKKKNGNKGEASNSQDPVNDGISSQSTKINSNLELNRTNYNICCVKDDSWYIDSGAYRHICMDRRWFKTFHKCDGDEFLYMGNSSTIFHFGEPSYFEGSDVCSLDCKEFSFGADLESHGM